MNQEKVGKIILLVIFGLILLSDIFVIFLMVMKLGPSALMPRVVRLLLTCGLFYAVYIGKVWARWVCVFLYVLGLFIVIASLQKSPNFPMIVILILFTAMLAALTVIPQTVAFLKNQNESEN